MKVSVKEVISDIEKLFELARVNVRIHPNRTKRYIRLARAISMRTKIRIPEKLKRVFCKKCFTYWIPGHNVRINTDPKRKITEYICECGAIRRFGYGRRKETEGS